MTAGRRAVRGAGRRAIAGWFVLLIAAGCASHGAKPVAVSATPTATRSNGVCLVSQTSEQPQHGRVTVAADPSSATALWLPGLNSTQCASASTPISRADARRLAEDIRSAPPVPPGIRHCPADDAATVSIRFAYPGEADEEVIAHLAGCTSLTAPGRSPRQLTPEVRRDLAPGAPPEWATYLD